MSKKRGSQHCSFLFPSHFEKRKDSRKHRTGIHRSLQQSESGESPCYNSMMRCRGAPKDVRVVNRFQFTVEKRNDPAP